MNAFLDGFSDELTKKAGVGKGALKLLGKKPLLALTGGAALAGTGVAAARGYKRGLKGGEKGRYLAATPGRPSRAAYTNYHRFFKHKPGRAEKRRLHYNYDEDTFKR